MCRYMSCISFAVILQNQQNAYLFLLANINQDPSDSHTKDESNNNRKQVSFRFRGFFSLFQVLVHAKTKKHHTDQRQPRKAAGNRTNRLRGANSSKRFIEKERKREVYSNEIMSLFHFVKVKRARLC